MQISRVAIAIVVITIWLIPGTILGQEITGDDIVEIIPEESETFTLQGVEPSEDAAFIKAVYVYNPLGVEIPFYIAYGDDAELIREYTSVTYSTENFVYATDDSNLKEKLDDGESTYGIRSELRGGLSTKLLNWEMKNGNLQEEYPLIQLFSTNVGSFAMSSIQNKSSTSVRVNYKTADDKQSVKVKLYHGERARQEYQLAKCNWDEKESLDLDGTTYYDSAKESGGTALAPGAKESEMTVQAYIDDIFIELHLQDDTDNSDAQQVEQQMNTFVTNFDTDRFAGWTYPKGEEPAIKLTKEEFRNFFQEETEHFSLQQVESFEDAMHIKATYLFEPEDHEVTVHLAYREDVERLATIRNPLNDRGDFRVTVEPSCLDEKVDRSQFNSYLEELHQVVNESDLTKWEIEHANFEKINPLIGYIPKEVGSFNIVSLRREDEELLASGKYQQSGEEDEFYLLLNYGDEAAKKYNRFQLALFENKSTQHEVDGLSFRLAELNNRIVAFTYIDDLLIAAYYREPEQDIETIQQQLIDFLAGFEPGRLTDFQSPEDYEMEFTSEVNGTKRCLGIKCFEQQLKQCNSAQFGGRIQRRLGAIYEIEGSSGDSSCRLSFQYTRNPNSDLEDQPLYFTMDRNESFLEAGPDIVEECLEGDSESRNCEGPLLKMLSEE